jgi:stage V sporulation protein G
MTQTLIAPASKTTLFSDVHIIPMNKDNLRAMASCKIAGVLWLTGLRVVEGSKGRFVAMPSRKDNKGEYQDVFFPATRDIRDALQREILSEYEKAIKAA